MHLIVGLGNPGARHAGNRHNIGFMAVDAIARRHSFGPWRKRFQGVAVEGTLASARVMLLLPGTYMNESGGGGIAGHNGLRSICEHIGVDYRRVRIGVGHPGDRDMVANYVLSDFAKSEHALFAALCDIIADNAALLTAGQDANFQNKVHLALQAKGLAPAPRSREADRDVQGNDDEQGR
ncbi:MAG: peptidyl-tRNA hydrolase [Proteobacteria bacterium]|nr:peptidyl-tRNA hydrolase [Pseudomonadota bacterium]